MQRILRRAAVALSAMIIQLGVSSAAWAQEAAASSDQKSYVMPYFVVVLAVGLGTFLVCRPVNRADAGRQDYFTGETPKGIRGEEFHEKG